MKPKHFIIPALAFFSVVHGYAQDTTVIFIPSGTSIREKVLPAKLFRYPEFRPGKVVFKDGSVASAQLNYSFLSGEVEFIGPANDTLAISDDKTPLLKDIWIDSTVFYYNKEYYEEIASHPETGRLLKKQLFVEMIREKTGAYDMVAPNSSNQTYGSVVSKRVNSFPTGLANENLFIKLVTNYFIENGNEILPVNKKNLLKLYSSRRKAINDYLDRNPVNFNREDDLKRLFIAIR